MELATFGAGCFWGVEERFRKVDGVLETAVGYMGGTTNNPTYEQVCTDRTGHAEVIQLTFDPAVVSYKELLSMFFDMHDPTTLNRQGPDIGTQYRSVVFYHHARQQEQAVALKKHLDDSEVFSKPIVTEIVPAKTFFRAEEYHQQYLQKRGLGSCHL